ncbi:response regulator [Desulfotruncus alcoholivorax]|uniref:response regulator n=1 Tax=Desulfotruncus alcoholivorax TaxID=265477 RepID=UPI000425B9E0|nr:response regulator [Desulfotruncus alcoholivorax]
MINILVVDDSGVVRLQVKQMLKGYSCNVYEASSGMQVIMGAFDRDISLLDIDIILLDVHLGKIDGYRVLAHVVKNYPNIPVIMMSVDGTQDVIIKSIQMGAKDFLLKPITRDLLLAKIGKFYDIFHGNQNGFTEMDNLMESLLLEIERAVRAKTFFVILVLCINHLEYAQKAVQIKQLKKELHSMLRRIDNVFIYKNKVVLLLPYTQKSGVNNIMERIYTVFKRRGLSFLNQETKTFAFPDDVAEELIKTYNNKAIKDLALQIII